jgi:lipoyl(octanoyl) transferase
MNKLIQLQDLGNKDYQETYQEELFKGIVDLKIKNRRGNQYRYAELFSFVEHPHVYTGKSGDLTNLLLSEKQLAEKERLSTKLIEEVILRIMVLVKL